MGPIQMIVVKAKVQLSIPMLHSATDTAAVPVGMRHPYSMGTLGASCNMGIVNRWGSNSISMSAICGDQQKAGGNLSLSGRVRGRVPKGQSPCGISTAGKGGAAASVQSHVRPSAAWKSAKYMPSMSSTSVQEKPAGVHVGKNCPA